MNEWMKNKERNKQNEIKLINKWINKQISKIK